GPLTLGICFAIVSLFPVLRAELQPPIGIVDEFCSVRQSMAGCFQLLMYEDSFPDFFLRQVVRPLGGYFAYLAALFLETSDHAARPQLRAEYDGGRQAEFRQLHARPSRYSLHL